MAQDEKLVLTGPSGNVEGTLTASGGVLYFNGRPVLLGEAKAPVQIKKK